MEKDGMEKNILRIMENSGLKENMSMEKKKTNFMVLAVN